MLRQCVAYEDEPHLRLGVVVLVEPFAPLVSSLSDKGLHGLRSLPGLSAQRFASAGAARNTLGNPIKPARRAPLDAIVRRG